MKSFARKLTAFTVTLVFLTISPLYSSAQSRFMGELTVTKTSAAGFVTVNGERAESGRSVMSSAEITTSPQASAKIILPQTGTVLIAPNAKLNLSFVNASISGDLSFGEITIETAPNTTLNFLTPDGAITLPVANQSNVIKITVENKRTRVQTLTGQLSFNNVLVAAGEFYPTNDDNDTKPVKPVGGSSGGINPLLIVGILGAVGAIALVALSSSSGGSNADVPVLSPVR